MPVSLGYIYIGLSGSILWLEFLQQGLMCQPTIATSEESETRAPVEVAASTFKAAIMNLKAT